MSLRTLRRAAAHPRILPFTALVLRARTVRRPVTFALRELRGHRTAAYDLRGRPGRIVVRHGGGDAVTVGEVYHERHYDPPPALAAGPAPALVVDLGANIGLFGVVAAHRWPDARVVAFEPDPRNADVCDRAIALNGLGARAAALTPTAPIFERADGHGMLWAWRG